MKNYIHLEKYHIITEGQKGFRQKRSNALVVYDF